MKTISNKDAESIADAIEVNDTFADFVLEKDLLVTEALRCISAVEDERFRVVFCGGTCLSKAYKAISRMSEDIDFKIDLLENGTFSHNRRVLSDYKKQIVARLDAAGFSGITCKARNGNQFFSFHIPYESRYADKATSLRPVIRAEFMTITPQDNCEVRHVTSIVDDLLGETDSQFPVTCLSLRETLIEKTVALLRRMSDDRDSISTNPYLIRHVYDMHQILQQGELAGDERFVSIFRDKLANDIKLFGAHCDEFAANPQQLMLGALNRLAKEPVFEEHYQELLEDLILEAKAPDYETALSDLTAFVAPLIQRTHLVENDEEDEDEGPRC